MSTSNHPLSKKDPLSTKNIRRGIIIVGLLLILVLTAFSAYYYWDRFLPRGEQSPAETAMQEVEQAVKENPQDPAQRMALARVYFENRMYPEALDHASQVLGANSEDEEALLIAGLSSIRLEQPTEAIPYLEHFITLRKDSPMAKSDTTLEMSYYFVGESYNKLGQSENAIPLLEAALEITPTDADALYQLGMARQSQAQCETALESYHMAVRLVPDFTEAYQGMVECYSLQNEPGRVEYAQGMQAFGLKDYALAQTHLQKAVQILPEFAPALLGLGLTYEKQSELNAAAEVLQQALALDPHDLASRQALGRVEAALSTLKSQENSK